MARNLVRFIDQLPFFYAVGVISMFVTRQHQRLGDLAAGTLVVRDREEETPAWGEGGALTFTAQIFAPATPVPEPHTAVTLPVTGIARLSSADLVVLEGFFSRRLDMSRQPASCWPSASPPLSRQSLAWSHPLKPASKPFLRLWRASSETLPGSNKANSKPRKPDRPFANLLRTSLRRPWL